MRKFQWVAFRRVCVLAVAALTIFAAQSSAQSITGDILGSVHDPSDAIVVAAVVTLTATDTGITVQTTTNSDGNYLFAQQKPGTYSVSVSAAGFSTSTISDITLQIGEVRLRCETGKGFEFPTQSSLVARNASKKVDRPHWEWGLDD